MTDVTQTIRELKGSLSEEVLPIPQGDSFADGKASGLTIHAWGGSCLQNHSPRLSWKVHGTRVDTAVAVEASSRWWLKKSMKGSNPRAEPWRNVGGFAKLKRRSSTWHVRTLCGVSNMRHGDMTPFKGNIKHTLREMRHDPIQKNKNKKPVQGPSK